MQRGKSGRPSGTDGSDFSYRMVVDSRYTKVTKGKSRLKGLIFTQVVIQLIGLVVLAVSAITVEKSVNTLAVSTSLIGLISLLLGEIGRRRSRVGLLRVFVVTSTIAAVTLLYRAISSESALKVIQEGNFESILMIKETLLHLFGLVVQIFTVSIVFSLIGNMSPPKKAS